MATEATSSSFFPERKDDDNTSTKITEKKINMPKPFTGKREDLKKFIQDVLLYFVINRRVYNTDEDKIVFTMSFMEEGDAASWKEQFVDEKLKAGSLNLGTWDEFEELLKKAFTPYDAPGDALDEMKALRYKGVSIEDHVAKFKRAATKSGLSENSAAIIDYFRESLSIPLQKKIMTLENPPTTFEKWCDWAMKMDNNFKKMQRAIDRARGKTVDNGKKKEEPPRHWNFPRRDPNAMDIDAMTIEQRNEMMRKGLCFICEKPGHLGRNCPTKGQSSNE